MDLTQDECDVIICEHEGAHAVADWLQGNPVGELKYDADGGSCANSDERYVPQHAVTGLLAGHAWCFGIKQFLGDNFDVTAFPANTSGKSTEDENLARTINEEVKELRLGSESTQKVWNAIFI